MKLNSNQKSFLVITLFVIALVTYLTLLPKTSNWYLTYLKNEQEPYDLSVFMHSLKNQPDINVKYLNTFVKSTEIEKSSKTYILFDREFEVTYNTKKNLLDLIEQGNDIFIITTPINSFNLNPETIFDNEVDYEQDSVSYFVDSNVEDAIINKNNTGIIAEPMETLEQNYTFSELDNTHFSFNFLNYPKHKANFFNNELNLLSWHYFSNDPYPNDVIQLNLNNKPVWISKNFESGTVHLISTPFIFTNYFLKQDTNLNTLNAFYEQIRYKDIRVFYNCSQAQFDYEDAQNNLSNISKIIKNSNALQLGIGLMVFFGLLYMFFGGKRTQKEMPIEADLTSSHVLKSNFLSNYYLKKDRLNLLKNKLLYQFEVFIFFATQINIKHATPKEIEYIAKKLNTSSEELKQLYFDLNSQMSDSKKEFIILHNKTIKLMNYGK